MRLLGSFFALLQICLASVDIDFDPSGLLDDKMHSDMLKVFQSSAAVMHKYNTRGTPIEKAEMGDIFTSLKQSFESQPGDESDLNTWLQTQEGSDSGSDDDEPTEKLTKKAPKKMKLPHYIKKTQGRMAQARGICKFCQAYKGFAIGKFKDIRKCQKACNDKKCFNQEKILEYSNRMIGHAERHSKLTTKGQKQKCSTKNLRKKHGSKIILRALARKTCTMSRSLKKQTGKKSFKQNFGKEAQRVLAKLAHKCKKHKKQPCHNELVDTHSELLMEMDAHLDRKNKKQGTKKLTKYQIRVQDAMRPILARNRANRQQAAKWKKQFCKNHKAEASFYQAFIEDKSDKSPSGKFSRRSAEFVKCLCSEKKVSHCATQGVKMASGFRDAFAASVKGECQKDKKAQEARKVAKKDNFLEIMERNHAATSSSICKPPGWNSLKMEFCINVGSGSCVLKRGSGACIVGSCHMGHFKVIVTLCTTSIKIRISLCLPGVKELVAKIKKIPFASSVLKDLGFESDGCLLIAEGEYDWHYQRVYLHSGERCLNLEVVKACANVGMYARVKDTGSPYTDKTDWKLKDTYAQRGTQPWFNFLVSASVGVRYPAWCKGWPVGYPCFKWETWGGNYVNEYI